MINKGVIFLQKVGTVLVVSVLLAASYLIYKPESKVKQEELLININEADLKTLIKVPYIGEKTATKILQMRRKLGYFKDINQLKNLRNFKKFKYYLKVE